MLFEDGYGNLRSGDEVDNQQLGLDKKLPGFEEMEEMMFEDKYGNLMTAEEVDELSLWEVEDRGLHLFEWRL